MLKKYISWIKSKYPIVNSSNFLQGYSYWRSFYSNLTNSNFNSLSKIITKKKLMYQMKNWNSDATILTNQVKFC